MEQQCEDNSYYNYSILSTNLTNGSNKFKKIFQLPNPVQIQSYGNNNFVVELKYTKKNKANDEYDYIEKELKKSKKTKAYTTYTEISNEESLFFCAQNQQQNKKNSPDSKNYITYFPENTQNKNNNQQIYRKEDIDTFFYPSEKIYLPNNMKQNRNELKYQRFCASFLSKSPTSNRTSPKKKIFQKKININKQIISERKSSGYSKSKNQLEDFNIDKLKEIGDNFALRYLDRINQQKKINLHKSQSPRFINNIETIFGKKEKYDGIVNKIIMIEKTRNESKNKINLINRTDDKINNIKKNIKNNNNISNSNSNNNFKKYKKRIVNNESGNLTHRINGVNGLEKDKEEMEYLKDSNYPIKIKLNNLVKRKKYNSQLNMNSKDEIIGYGYNSNLKGITNGRIDNYKNIYNYNSNNKVYNNKIISNNKIYSNDGIYSNNKEYSNNKIYSNNKEYNNNNNNKPYINVKNDKIYHKYNNKISNSINSKVIMDKSKDNENIRNKNINHNYFESINIKTDKKFKKNQNSFNNAFVSLQK